MRRGTVTMVIVLSGVTACGNKGAGTPNGKNACESINIASIGPGTGTQMLCTGATDCREDVMAQKFDATFCADKSKGSCPAGNAACSNQCAGVVNSSGLKASGCVWDNTKKCDLPGGGAGAQCTCKWEIPAGSSLACGCGCT
jgi:hypothetical protein